jgi:hypothetical protein
MTPSTFLLANLALAFYNIRIIWAHEIDIFRSWIGALSTEQVSTARWHPHAPAP